MVKKLKTEQKDTRNIEIGVLNGDVSIVSSSNDEFEIFDVNNEKKFKIQALTTKKVVRDLSAINWEVEKQQSII